MSGSSRKLMGTTAAGGAEFLAVEDVFQSWLYTGNGSTQTITNGIDLAGEGGLVWIKARNLIRDHQLADTERGVNKNLESNTTDAENSNTSISSFNSDGFTIGTSGSNWNESPEPYASWTFRKAPRFFDVVTYTGNGVAGRQIAHNLGTTVGTIIVKKTNDVAEWAVFHRSIGGTGAVYLNLTSSTITSNAFWNNTGPTDAVFTVGSSDVVNTNGATYVAYLFAHDPLGPSEDGSDGLIACGSYTGNGSSTGPVIDLGWEPQWVMIKCATNYTLGNWLMLDTMRGWTANSGNKDGLYADLSGAEIKANSGLNPTSTGFQIRDTTPQINGSGNEYIYIAIRRGPMRAPESGTEVFAPVTRDSSVGGVNYYTGFPVDLSIFNARTGPGNYFHARLTASGRLQSVNTAAEIAGDAVDFTSNVGYQPGTSSTTTNALTWNFRRAPGFFDVVAYTGNGVAGRTVPHNLGVAPEMMIVKRREGSGNGWKSYVAPLGPTYALTLNETSQAELQGSTLWNSTAPSSEVFSVGTNAQSNASGGTYIAYLFATLPGVSKVGSYTGNGSSQTINCSFTGGARFVLIKRTDSTGDWYVWDTARGIVSGNDPHLSLNTTAAEVTSDDTIDPDSSGFIVNQVAATNVNVSSASYIYLAIA